MQVTARECAINPMLRGIGSEKSVTVKAADPLAADANKQLYFMQHIKTLLRCNGRAAVVVPDSVLIFKKKPASETP